MFLLEYKVKKIKYKRKNEYKNFEFKTKINNLITYEDKLLKLNPILQGEEH